MSKFAVHHQTAPGDFARCATFLVIYTQNRYFTCSIISLQKLLCDMDSLCKKIIVN